MTHVDGARLQQRPEPVQVVEVLAGRDRHLVARAVASATPATSRWWIGSSSHAMPASCSARPPLRARVERPRLVDVHHDPDVRPDGLAHGPHALRFELGRRLAAHPELDAVEAGLGVTAGRGRQLGGAQAVPEPVARVGRHPVAKAAEQSRERLAECLAVGVPDRDVERRQREVQQAAGPHPVSALRELVPCRLGLEHAHAHEMLAQLARRHPDRRHEIRPRVDDVADALDAVGRRDARQHVPVRIDRASARGIGTLDGHPQHVHRHVR